MVIFAGHTQYQIDTLGLFCYVYDMRNDHVFWFKRVTRHDSNRQVAENAGISAATLGRQLKAGELSADLIIKIAEAYDESPVIALVDLGFMSARWITEPGVRTALSRASDEELTDELLRRLRLLDDAPVDDLAARRACATPDVEDGFYAQAVADDSEDEEEGYPDDYDA